MPTAPPDFTLASLRGGLNTTDPPNALADDECTVAENVEFYFSSLGERRRGCAPLPATGTALDNEAVIVFAIRHFPTEYDKDAELWVIGATPGVSVTIARRTAGLVWSVINLTPADTIDNTSPNIYNIQGVSFDNKLFLAFKSNVDRLHVWDGATLRRTGLAEPSAPAVANTAVVGTYTDVRYFRVRYIVEVAGVIKIRSEPSDATTFTPDLIHNGAIITKPAAINEGETHWELEASPGSANYYRIATIPVGTPTYTDTTQPSSLYATNGVLSDDIGTYALEPSAKFLQAADDRLLLGASWQDANISSRVMWTPVRNDPGVGNDERLVADINYFLDLNNYEGGGLTGITEEINGSWYAMKWSQIYKLTRTNTRARAYDPFTITKKRGAIPGSIFSGMDEIGRASNYFMDPHIGPSRIGVDGLKHLYGIYGLKGIWNRVNVGATVPARGVYYPDKHQVWFWVAVDGSDTPNLGLKLQVTELQQQSGGELRRGWSTFTGQLAQVYAATLMQETISVTGGTQLVYRPYVGMATPFLMQRADVGVNDGGTAFRAILRTKPFFQAGLLNRWGAMAAALLASADSTASVVVKLIRNYGIESQQVTTDLAPVDTEEYVVKPFDNLHLSELTGMQIEFSDPE